MKAVMKSVSPRICEKVANGDCTILVSKTAPKCNQPFKGYIYCTSSDVHRALVVGDGDAKLIHCCNYKSAIPVGGAIGNGKVIGEFICDKVYNLDYLPNEYSGKFGGEFEEMICKESCLSYDEIMQYKGKKPLYGWHISNLKIYDKPKELSEFKISCNRKNLCYSCNRFTGKSWDICNNTITRPPQSYMYVEEL